MIVCSKCKKFVKNIEYMINGFEDISDVTGVCKLHGRVKVDYDDYDEIVPTQDADTVPKATGE